jgi:transcriptional regulator with XRE-family HTH domain
MSFRENLRAELDYNNLTVKELCSKTGIAKGTLDCYLGLRASMPPADAAVKIASVLNVSVEYLVTGEEKDHSSLSPGDRTIRSIVQIILNLNERDCEIMLELAKILKKKQDLSAKQAAL